MTMIGADVDELRALAADVTRGSAELSALSAELARTIDAAQSWQGPDAVRCKEQLGELARARIGGVADALADAGRHLERQAAEQEAGSQAVPAAAARPGLLAQLLAWGKAGWSAYKLPEKWRGLQAFFAALGRSSFFGRTRAAVLAVEKAVGMSGDSGVGALLARVGGWVGKDLGPLAQRLAPFGKVASKIMLPVSAALSIPDVVDGGGRPGWRGEVTRWTAAGNVVGAVVLVGGTVAVGTAALATAPILVAGAATLVGVHTAWSLWTAGEDAWASSPALREKVGGAWEAGWSGARSLLDVSRTWARGLLGPPPRTAGAAS